MESVSFPAATQIRSVFLPRHRFDQLFRNTASFFCCLHKMVNSIDGENSEVHGDQQEELVAPVFAEDLAPNVRAGFDNTCDYIRRSHAALSAQITRLAVRIDALGDAPARAAV